MFIREENLENIYDYNIEELEKKVISLGEPKFRAGQIFQWLYKGISSFDDMANIHISLRNKLKDSFSFSTVSIIKAQVSKLDGTRKYLLGLEDGNAIESVFMKYKFGNSICVSSQVGCRMGCKFCASTIGGLKRQLSAGEIVQEILAIERNTGEKISHVVVMGTGEPFDNYENLAKFIRIINDKKGLNIGMRNITVSTCGIIPMIYEFAKDFPQVNLAISLHGNNNDMRSSIMPINKKYPIEEIIRACRDYVDMTSRRITFEYTLVKDFNDRNQDAYDLARLLKGILCHVNLIPLNKVEERNMETTERKRALEFQKILEKEGITATIRRELGDDIDAACGQLRLGHK